MLQDATWGGIMWTILETTGEAETSEILEPRWQGRYTFAAFAYLVFLRRSYFFRTLDTGAQLMHSVYWYIMCNTPVYVIRQLNTCPESWLVRRTA